MIKEIELSHFDELMEYCNMKDLDMKGNKAIVVITKCIQRGHYQLADKIGLKYRRILPKNDMMVAFKMSLGYSTEREGKPADRNINVSKHD